MTFGVRWIGFQRLLKESQSITGEVLVRENHSELNLSFGKGRIAG